MVAFTGAGISAESGIPTFREALTGIWARFQPEDMATEAAFTAHPALVWQWYEAFRAQVAMCSPNAAHWALAELERRVPEFTLITQNIDGLHQRAGSSVVHELHGNLFGNHCLRCHTPVLHVAPGQMEPPVCARCGSWVRPSVVWFGEGLPEAAWQAAVTAATEAEVFFIIGTSSLVYPAAQLPYLAREAGAYVVQVNPQATAHDRLADEVLRGPAGVALPAFIEEVWPAC